MPKIPEAILHGTFYLYRNEEDARTGRNVGGSGFFIGRGLEGTEGRSRVYAVTNWHVACRGASVIRLNRVDGGINVIALAPEDWVFDPQGHDLAIAPIRGLDPNAHEVRFFSDTSFATDQAIRDRGIGPGEDVFMAGLLVDAQGLQRNQPAVRFGNISMMPNPIRNLLGNTVPTYCIDTHSRTGFSGSPVWVYRKPGQDLTNGNLNMGDQFLYLLGIHYGQFPELWEITGGPEGERNNEAMPDESTVSLTGNQRYVRGMSGMTLVVPAAAILALLSHDTLKMWFEAGRLPNGTDVASPR